MLRRNVALFGCVGLAALLGWASVSTAQETREPKKTRDVVDTAVASKDHTTLVELIKAAGLVAALKEEGPFTVFAPTNDAFAKLPKETLDSLKKPENKEKLAKILKLHVVSGKVMAQQVLTMNDKSVKTLAGEEIKITVKDGKVMVNNSTVTKTDIDCSNGVIHVVDTVLLPKAEG